MKTVKIMLSEHSINEVTAHYVSLIESGLKQSGHLSVRVSNISQIEYKDLVVTILPSDATKAILLKNSKVIHWFQGIGPEEYCLLHAEDKNQIRVNVIERLLESQERFILKHAFKRIFVSEAMAKHYQNKYGYVFNDYIAIPCYNTTLNISSDVSRYMELSFIYAGSSHAWQRLDKMLRIFKAVQQLDSSAYLTIMTKDKQGVSAMASELGLDNVLIDYTTQNKLDSIMARHKYAFLIRDDIIVNRVSTPTKMANYISSGLMPIYSDVIEAFQKNIDLGDFGIPISDNMDFEDIAQKILHHHVKTRDSIDVGEMLIKHQGLFSNYYSDSFNISKILKYFEEL